MSELETERLINELIDHARLNYEIRQEGLKAWEEINRMLDDPGLIRNKKMALGMCRILLRFCAEKGGMKEGSILHRMGLRLMDYINRSTVKQLNNSKRGEHGETV